MTTKTFNPDKRAAQKKFQRQQDTTALASQKISRAELQQQNSMFSGINWSDVEIIEPSGYRWRVVSSQMPLS
jgi:hypothetical protein